MMSRILIVPFLLAACGAKDPPPPAQGGVTARIARTMAHDERVWNVAFAPDGATLASCGVDGTVRIWRVADGSLVRRLDHPQGVTNCATSPDGRWIASTSYDLGVHL